MNKIHLKSFLILSICYSLEMVTASSKKSVPTLHKSSSIITPELNRKIKAFDNSNLALTKKQNHIQACIAHPESYRLYQVSKNSLNHQNALLKDIKGIRRKMRKLIVKGQAHCDQSKILELDQISKIHEFNMCKTGISIIYHSISKTITNNEP